MMNQSTRLRTAVAVLAVAVGAMACSGTSDSASTTQPPAAPETATSAASATPAEPLLDIPSGMTWQQAINEIAGKNELACIDNLLGDELPDGLLDITVTEPVGWPIVTTELIGIEIGDDQWPHELWRCMSPQTAAAVYLSVFAQEEGLTRDVDIDAEGTACIAALPQNGDFADIAAEVLGSEASFSDGDDLADFMGELDDVAADLILPCIAESALEQFLLHALGDDLSGNELACLTGAMIDEARSDGVDLSALFNDSLSDAEFDGLFEHLLLSAIEVCLSADTAITPDDGTAASPVSTFAAVSAGDYYSCGLRTDASVTCWGDNDFGQLVVPADDLIAVSAGEIHACGIRTDESVICWGGDVYGKVDGPLDVPSDSFTAVSAGAAFSCGIRTDGSVICWGHGYDAGPVAPLDEGASASNGDAADTGNNGEIVVPGGTFAAVSAGQWHACGIKTEGTITCWGSNEYGQSDAPSGSFTSISAGVLHTCGVRSDGTVTCWGESGFGQSDAPEGVFTEVSAAHRHSCGLRSNGTITCWGLFGIADEDTPAGDFNAVSAGLDHSCGLTPRGTVICWGSNEFGQSEAPDG